MGGKDLKLQYSLVGLCVTGQRKVVHECEEEGN